MTDSQSPSLALPAPDTTGTTTLEAALAARRTNRDFRDGPLTLAQAAQLLWAAQGITSDDGRRTAPSAGESYPLGLHLLAAEVEGLEQGIYAYDPATHALTAVLDGDRREALAEAGIGDQPWLEYAAAVLIVSGDISKSLKVFGDQPGAEDLAPRYVHIESGHAAQNVYLQATVLDLAAVLVGGFEDDAVLELGFLEDGFSPLGMIAVGLA